MFFKENLLFLDSKASTGSPFPKPLKLTFSTLFKPILSFWVMLNNMVLLTPESKIKESFLPLIFNGITIKLLINLNLIHQILFFQMMLLILK